jgi:hypothetical protein
MLTQEIMSELSDCDNVVVDQEKLTLWPKAMVAKTEDTAL